MDAITVTTLEIYKSNTIIVLCRYNKGICLGIWLYIALYLHLSYKHGNIELIYIVN